jgi:hypothetical protein
VRSFEIRRIGPDHDPPPAAQALQGPGRRNLHYQQPPPAANHDDGPVPTIAQLSDLDELRGTDDYQDVLSGGRALAGRLSVDAVGLATLQVTPSTGARAPSTSPAAVVFTSVQQPRAGAKRKATTTPAPATGARAPSTSPAAGSFTSVQQPRAGAERKATTTTTAKPRAQRGRRASVPPPPAGSAAAERLAAAQKSLSLRVDLKEKQVLIDACVAFCATPIGGQTHVKRQTQPKSSANHVKLICVTANCPFGINLRQGKGSGYQWYVDWKTSNFEHSKHQCAPRLLLAGRPPRSLVSRVKSMGPSMAHVSNISVDKLLRQAGYHVPAVANSSWKNKRQRLKEHAFQTNAAGIQFQLDRLISWMHVFNSRPSNGVATLHTMKEPHSSVPVFRALTVVFAPSVQLFLHCSWRVLSIDAAFEYKGRSDKNYIILEGITSTSTIFPLAFGFCFGESTATYNQFWIDVLAYSEPLKSAIDSPSTRINADRHKGIRKSTETQLQHGAKILHNDSVHLKRNVRTALQQAGCPFSSEQVGHNADRLLDELMNCRDVAVVDRHWDAIKAFNSDMESYLRGCEPQWWVEAYFQTCMDGGKTTSNNAEQENSRFKTHGLRSMALLDFVDGVCDIVTGVATEYLRNAQQHLEAGRQYTSFASRHIEGACFESSDLHAVGDLVAGRGTFVVHHNADSGGIHGCQQQVVTVCDGQYECDHIDQYSVRMGLPSEAMYAVMSYITASNPDKQQIAPPLFVHSVHKNQTIVDALQGNVSIVIPNRATLQPYRGVVPCLRYPACDSNTHVKQPKSRKGVRGRKHSDKPTASSAVPRRQPQVHPTVILAQQRLLAMKFNGPDYLIVLHRNLGPSESCFDTKHTKLRTHVNARDMWRPYQYMPSANARAPRDGHGKQYVLLQSLLKPPGPRKLRLDTVLDAVVVDRTTMAAVRAGKQWRHPALGVQPPLQSLLQSDTTAVASFERRLQQPNDGDCDGDGPTAGNGVPNAAAKAAADEYDVDNIVDHRPCTIPGQYEYKVHWAGYASTDDTWESADSVASSNDLVQKYLATAPPIWTGVTEPLKFASLAFGQCIQVLHGNGAVHSAEWKLATVTAKHKNSCTVAVRTVDNINGTSKSIMMTVSRDRWLRYPAAATATA